jgi:plasmid stability protein
VNRKPDLEPEKPAEPVIRLSVDLPESLHIKLKIRCATTRQKMGEAVRALIERELAEAA